MRGAVHERLPRAALHTRQSWLTEGSRIETCPVHPRSALEPVLKQCLPWWLPLKRCGATPGRVKGRTDESPRGGRAPAAPGRRPPHAAPSPRIGKRSGTPARRARFPVTARGKLEGAHRKAGR